MKLADMKKKSVADLEKHATKLQTKIAEFKRDRHISEVKNVKAMRNDRKELARVLTVLKEKEGEK